MALVGKAERSPDGVDFAAMRKAYMSSHYYRRYESDPENFRAAKLLGQADPTPDEIRKYVHENFAIAGAHLVAIGYLGLKVDTPGFNIDRPPRSGPGPRIELGSWVTDPSHRCDKDNAPDRTIRLSVRLPPRASLSERAASHANSS